MPEKHVKFNIEKQESGRDFYNIAGNLIIQHPITHEPVYIPSIQSVLRKGETTDGEFFKKEPEWVDYEQGYIVERKEVSEIIKNLENEKVQLVLGKPAAGKSVILKNVGFKLANQNKKVHIVELKKHQIKDVKLYFETIPEINDDNPIFIVDDAHLYPSECEKLIRDFKSGGKGNLIIGSRPTEDILPSHPKKSSEFKFLNKTEIHSEDIKEEMIRCLLKRKHKEYNFSDDRIKIVSKNLQKYKSDLWQLSWALNAYKPEKDSVDEEEIYENMIKSITEIEAKDKKTINAEDVFLPLSILYRFEIPVERDFLEEQLDIEEDILNQLIELSEIIETKEMGNKKLSLHHSSLAELYFGAYKKYSAFGKKIKKNILNGKDEEFLEYCSFYRYITTTDPRNALDVLKNLTKYLSNKKDAVTLFRKLIEEEKIQKLIEKGIEKEEDIDKIRRFIKDSALVSKEVGLKLVKSIDIDTLSLKIEKEEDMYKIGFCLFDISKISREDGLKLVNNIDIEILSMKIELEEDIGKIDFCVLVISRISNKVGLELAKRMDIHVLSKKIEKEEDIEKIGVCVDSFVEISREFGFKLVNNIDIDTLSTKINNEKNVGMIVPCVSYINWASKEVGLKLVNNINIYTLGAKIEEEEDINRIGLCVKYIADASKDVGLNLVNIINIDSLSSKIEKENKIEKIGTCVSNIAKVNKEVASEIVNHLSPKLKEQMPKECNNSKTPSL